MTGSCFRCSTPAVNSCAPKGIVPVPALDQNGYTLIAHNQNYILVPPSAIEPASEFRGINGELLPSDAGYAAWNSDPFTMVDDFEPVLGEITMIKIRLTQITSISQIALCFVNAVTTPTTGQNFVGLYDMAGTRLAVSTNANAFYSIPGVKDFDVGPLLLAPGEYYVAALFNAVAAPSLLAEESSTLMLNSTPIPLLPMATYGTALTSLPTSIVLDNLERDLLPQALNISYAWAALL